MKAVALVMTGLVLALAASSPSQGAGQIPGESGQAAQAPRDARQVPGESGQAAMDTDQAAQAPREMNQRIEDSRREQRIFAFYSTTSVKRLATTTITLASTCLSITNNPGTCNGRKKRKVVDLWEPIELDVLETETLDGSIQDEADETIDRQARGVEDRKGKRLTIWTTFLSTLTITSTSYLAGTTISATALCTAGVITANTCFG